jgi:hypothetical protein
MIRQKEKGRIVYIFYDDFGDFSLHASSRFGMILIATYPNGGVVV